MKKTILTIAISLIVGAISGFMFSSHETLSEKTEYKKQSPVTGSVTHPAAKSETTPEQPVLPIRIDTFYKDKIKYVTQTVDTAAIIADYIKKRSYEITAFDKPDIGKLEVKAEVQYNSLDDISYTFTPVIKETKIKAEKVLIPFVGISYSTLGAIGAGGGVFYHNIGVEYQCQLSTEDISKNGHWVSLKYKF